MTRNTIFEPGNVGVVTGAALGIGRALALRMAEMGMSVVMSDLDSSDFDEAVNEVRNKAKRGRRSVLAMPVDVSDPEQIAGLKTATLEAFGKVNLLANNAVSRMGRGIHADLDEWRRAMEVNLWGPIFGVRAFLPSLLENPGPACVINVGSKQGITNPPGHPIYNMSKSALKTYTEVLAHELRTMADNVGDSHVSAHLLVPGWTTTGKAEHSLGAWLPEQVIDLLIEAVNKDQFYIICPDDETTSDMDKKRIIWGAQDITENRPPLSRWHPDFAEIAKQFCS